MAGNLRTAGRSQGTLAWEAKDKTTRRLGFIRNFVRTISVLTSSSLVEFSTDLFLVLKMSPRAISFKVVEAQTARKR
jgi:hypothetical protein